MGGIVWFQSQTRRLLPRNIRCVRDAKRLPEVSIADATLASPQPGGLSVSGALRDVSIADATLASPQPCWMSGLASLTQSFNRRRDACFPATMRQPARNRVSACFNRRRDACFPATLKKLVGKPLDKMFQSQTRRLLPRNVVSDNLLAMLIKSFNRRRDACFPATSGRYATLQAG